MYVAGNEQSSHFSCWAFRGGLFSSVGSGGLLFKEFSLRLIGFKNFSCFEGLDFE
jgi:hypothetical protein